MIHAIRLYERFRQLIHEAAKFGVVGAVAFVVNTVGFNILHYQAGVGPLTSTAIATIVATCVAYAGNRYWTFRHREGSGLGREYLLFFFFNGVGLVIQLGCVGFVRYILGFTSALALNTALILGIGLGTLFRWWSYRRWVWVEPRDETAEGAMSGGPRAPAAPDLVPADSASAGSVQINGWQGQATVRAPHDRRAQRDQPHRQGQPGRRPGQQGRATPSASVPFDS